MLRYFIAAVFALLSCSSVGRINPRFEQGNPDIKPTPIEVELEKEAITDVAESEKLAWEEMKIRSGETLLLDQSLKLYCIEDTPGTVEVHNAPIRYEKDDGSIEPIKLSWERGINAVYEALHNTVTAQIYKDGSFVYGGALDRKDNWSVRAIPVGMYIDGEKIEDTDGVWEFKQTNAKTIEFDGTWPHRATTRWELQNGLVKETIVLTEEFRKLLDGKKQFKIDTAIQDEASPFNWVIIVEEQSTFATLRRLETGTILAIFKDIVVVDAAGEMTTGHYEYDANSGVLSAVIDASWLADPSRAYPIEIDPTTTQNDANEFNNCGSSGGTGNRNRFWLKFDLPAINGTCDSVNLVMNFSANNLAAETIDTNIYTSASSAWVSNSSTCATMDGLTYYSTGVNNAFTSGTGTGDKTWSNIHGTTDPNSIKYLYDDVTNGVCDPGTITVKVQNVGTGSTQRSAGSYLSEDSDGDTITFDTASACYLSITYTGSLSCAGGGVVPGTKTTGVGIIQ